MSALTLARKPLKGFKPTSVNLGIINHFARPSSSKNNEIEDDDGFRTFNLRPTREKMDFKKRRPIHLQTPRNFQRNKNLDPETVDWKSVWPGPRTFDPNSIPLPIYQGRIKAANVPLNKYANPELMKIPNFFHLTPPAIKAHCEELKKFCTPFPKELDTKEKCEELFPLKVITNDYLHSAPTIRDPLARIVTFKLKLKNIPLDEHARDKFLRLVKNRYDDKTDTLTIVTDRCPLRKQNYDYAQYLLTALFYESWTVEEWEAQKCEADMEKYIWKNNLSAKALASILMWTPDKMGKSIFHDPLPDENLKPEHHSYGFAVKKVIEGESQESLNEYKKAALQILLGKEEASKTV